MSSDAHFEIDLVDVLRDVAGTLKRIEQRLAVLTAIALPMRGGETFNAKMADKVWHQGCAAQRKLAFREEEDV